jgi:chloramphenicol 3-O-phosphotransferase
MCVFADGLAVDDEQPMSAKNSIARAVITIAAARWFFIVLRSYHETLGEEEKLNTISRSTIQAC